VLQKVKPAWFEYNGEAGMPTDKKTGVLDQLKFTRSLIKKGRLRSEQK